MSELNAKGLLTRRTPITEAEILAFVVTQIAGLRKCELTMMDPDRPFNELGVDSLDGVHLANDLEQQFSITVDPMELFDHPTPRDLARMVAARSASHVQ